jgi:hypothetical protein
MDSKSNEIPAVLRKGSISTETHNILYGFYQTPMQALESMQKLYSAGLNAVKVAIKDEQHRLDKIAESLVKTKNTETN